VLLEYDLPDATGSAVRAEMKRIKPEVPVLLFAGVGSQTPFLLRFFDSYLRNTERPEWAFQDLDAESADGELRTRELTGEGFLQHQRNQGE
jgi:hypothetical protein